MKTAMTLIRQINLPYERRILKTLLAGGVFLGLLILFIVPPADLPLGACAFHSITGHSCLTCGMTRSLHAISHGELAVSVRYHLLGPAVFIGLLLFLVICSAEAITGKQSAIHISGKIRNQAAVVFATVWLVYWGVRLVAECVT